MSYISDQLEAKIGRRNLLQISAYAGASIFGGGLLAGCGGSNGGNGGGSGISDADILNFALNLEYLEAEYYIRATGINGTGSGSQNLGLAAGDISGTTTPGDVTVKSESTQVPFATDAIRQYAEEIAHDEQNHVRFLRSALGSAAVARPRINLVDSFNAAYAAATSSSEATFDPFANEINFLIGAFIFEDVGVTAYRGGAPLLSNRDNVSFAAAILGVEAYHAGAVRTILASRSTETVTATGNPTVLDAVSAISDLRDSVDNTVGTTYAKKFSNGLPFAPTGTDDDQSLQVAGNFNLVPTDTFSLVYSRTASQVLPIVYIGSTPTAAAPVNASFYPVGLNGKIK